MRAQEFRDLGRTSRAASLGVALVAVIIAAGINATLWEEFGRRYPLILFYPAIMVAAWFGGLWAGSVATTLSGTIGAVVWLQSPTSATTSRQGDVLALLIFVGVGLTISGLSESMKRHAQREHLAREQAERSEREARRLTDEIRASQDRLLEVERMARLQAEHANRVKDQFLSTVSHELRTPLNAILGWADLLRNDRLPEARRARALQAVYENARRQVRLIDDLLDVARIMTGKLRLERTAMDLRMVVQGALEIAEPAADAKGVRLGAEIDQDVALSSFFGDPTRLQQVIWNLLTNAVKFTPSGGRVQVKVQRRGASVDIIVRDTGRGIGREFLPYLFQPFRQGDASTRREHAGLGLGLSIVKHLVEAHGGNVFAESEGEGLGAAFIVRLPLQTIEVTPLDRETPSRVIPPSDAPFPSPVLLEGVSVLVVDDDADCREVVAASLEQVGADVITVESTEAALDVLQRRKIDVLLADIAMPVADGYELIAKVRQSPQPDIAGMAAIAVTSLARPEDQQQTRAAGFHVHLSKPVDPRSLIDIVGSLARRSRVDAAVSS